MNATRVYIAFGSNVGDRVANITAAIKKLYEFGKVLRVSDLYESEPEEYLEQDRFVNGVVEFETTLSAMELFKSIKSVEWEIGRRFGIKKGPREIDLDIVFYGSEKIDSPVLKIPHRAMHRREFVLAPLYGMIPGFIHPIIEKSVTELYRNCLAEKKKSTCRILSEKII
jgi:2-amino-4-hydroxy-6-hydroxymethyldihydropteridine diphosphokinase